MDENNEIIFNVKIKDIVKVTDISTSVNMSDIVKPLQIPNFAKKPSLNSQITSDNEYSKGEKKMKNRQMSLFGKTGDNKEEINLSEVNRLIKTESEKSQKETSKLIAPIFHKKDMLPINNRPLSPKDNTDIKVNGIKINNQINPIIIPNESDLTETNDEIEEIYNNYLEDTTCDTPIAIGNVISDNFIKAASPILRLQNYEGLLIDTPFNNIDEKILMPTPMISSVSGDQNQTNRQGNSLIDIPSFDDFFNSTLKKSPKKQLCDVIQPMLNNIQSPPIKNEDITLFQPSDLSANENYSVVSDIKLTQPNIFQSASQNRHDKINMRHHPVSNNAEPDENKTKGKSDNVELLLDEKVKSSNYKSTDIKTRLDTSSLINDEKKSGEKIKNGNEEERKKKIYMTSKNPQLPKIVPEIITTEENEEMIRDFFTTDVENNDNKRVDREENRKKKIEPQKEISKIINNLPELPKFNYQDLSKEKQAQIRADFITRFGILREAWPTYNIPTINENMTLEEIHATYDVYIKHINVSKEADQYKVYLVIMWLFIELICSKIGLGLNVGGYTMMQMKSMNKYERLLIELGENNVKKTSQSSIQNSWPVEIRLVFLSLVQAVILIIIKMLSSYIGENMANTIVDALSSYLSGTPPQPGQVLFGGPAAPSTSAPIIDNIPQNSNPFGNLDIPSLIGNFGSMFLKNQMGGAPAAAPSSAATPEPRRQKRGFYAE